MKKKTYLPTHEISRTIDARGKVLGRLATEVAVILMGKDKTTYAPHRVEGDKVVVTHSSDMGITGKKLDQKIYYSHSGYIGNTKSIKLRDLMVDKPDKVLEMAIYNMLPKNRLRKELMRRLTIYKADAPEIPQTTMKEPQA